MPPRALPLLAAFALTGAATAATPGLHAQAEVSCAGAHAFLVERGMAAVTEPYTIDDWRTDRTVEGCQITAAGLTERSFGEEIRAFFQDLDDAGWSRTPQPRDAPGESSVRFRKDGHDCLFSFYSRGLLATEAGFTVDEARVPGPGERRYNFHVMCMPAAPAAPR